MEKLLQEFSEWAKLGLLASFGGMASYVYIMVRKNKKFHWFTFLANLLIAFFVGKALGGFIPADASNATGWVMLLGFLAHPILDRVEDKFLARLDKITGFGDN
jgi:fluoride ion exporter CrcB/FEX